MEGEGRGGEKRKKEGMKEDRRGEKRKGRGGKGMEGKRGRGREGRKKRGEGRVIGRGGLEMGGEGKTGKGERCERKRIEEKHRKTAANRDFYQFVNVWGSCTHPIVDVDQIWLFHAKFHHDWCILIYIITHNHAKMTLTYVEKVWELLYPHP